MLELVTAVQYIKAIGSGRTKPLLFACEEIPGGDLIEVVVKFSSPQCGAGGIIREAVGSLLASDLELPVPRPLLVVLEEGLLGTMDMVPRDTVSSIQTSMFPTFGCQFVGIGASTFTPARTIAPRKELEAAEIFAFDALVLNPDRRAGNSNLLYDGREFVMFDHELCLHCAGVGGLLNPAPWQPLALSSLGKGESKHVLYEKLVNSNPNLDRLKATWSSINHERYAEYRAALPVEWNQHSETIEEIFAYLRDLGDNLDAAFAEVQRSLL